MKKIISFMLVLIILSTSFTVFAGMEEKVKDHWSKDIIDKNFVAYYFPYLAKNNFINFNPDDKINDKDFSLSLRSLSKDYKLEPTSLGPVLDKPLTRKEVVKLIGNKLTNIEALEVNSKKHSFKDVNTMDKESIVLLRLLFDLGIINGISEDEFAPDDFIVQSEAIIILQRVKGVLDNMKEISFTSKGIVQSYNNQEAVRVKQKDDKVLVTITKEFATPGYLLGIDKIVVDKDKYRVDLDITPPKEDSILPQVITYKTITIEIEENELTGQAPYAFIVEGIKSNLS